MANFEQLSHSMPNFEKLLADLVSALDSTHWSSWQTTATFSDELDAAREALASSPTAKLLLLKRLARAMDLKVNREFYHDDGNWGLWLIVEGPDSEELRRPEDYSVKFNPVLSNEDYAKVEAEFNCETKWGNDQVKVLTSNNKDPVPELYENHPDKLAARRWAGVRAVVGGL